MNRRITLPNNYCNSRRDVWMLVGLYRRQCRQYTADRLSPAVQSVRHLRHWASGWSGEQSCRLVWQGRGHVTGGGQ